MKAKLIVGYIIALFIGAGIGVTTTKLFFNKNIESNEQQKQSDEKINLKSEETNKWTHVELLKYLQKKNFKFKAESTEDGSFWGIPMYYKNEKNESLYVRLHDNPEKAKEYASSYGIEGFAWGKFLFGSKNPELLKAISAVLDNKFNEDFEFLSKNFTKSKDDNDNSSSSNIDWSKKLQLSTCIAAYAPVDHLMTPRVYMAWKNNSGASISESIEVEAVFYDNNKKEELGRASKFIHLSVDAPIKAGVSKQLYLTCERGWTFGPMDNLNVSVEIYINGKLLKTVKAENRIVEDWFI